MSISEFNKVTPRRFLISFAAATLMVFCLFKVMFNINETPRYNLSEEYSKIFETPFDSVQVTHYYYGHDRLSMDVEAKQGTLALRQQNTFSILKPTAIPEASSDIIPFLLGFQAQPYKIEPWVKEIFFKPLYDPNDVSADPKDIERSWGIWICVDHTQKGRMFIVIR